MSEPDVLIVGAGPTGLVLALWLARAGVKPRIIDKLAEPGTSSRALAVQARTLEFYHQLGIADRVLARGRQVSFANMWIAGRHVARAELGAMGAGISPYAYALIYPQDEHERMLIDALAQAGVTIEREVELTALDRTPEGMVAHLSSNGRRSECRPAFVAGCDGSHSIVRTSLGIGFGGGTYEHLFYVADVEASGATMNGELHVALDATDFLVVFPLKDEGRARLIGTVREDAGGGAPRDHLSWNDVGRRVIEWLRIDVTRVRWFSTYHVHHRVAQRFRDGNIFLLGDAAHVHSPVGGQGMNTGIGDAVNLAWKLASVVRGGASAALLDSYEPERIGFARRLVATTDRAFTAVTSSGALAKLVRLQIVPSILPTLLGTEFVRHAAFRTVSQTAIEYRDSAISEGHAGAVHAGDRLPWAPSSADAADNFQPLTSLAWQVHVYGDASDALRALCDSRRIELHWFAWTPAAARAGFRRDAIYLVRPDGYVGFAAETQELPALTAYLGRFQIA